MTARFRFQDPISSLPTLVGVYTKSPVIFFGRFYKSRVKYSLMLKNFIRVIFHVSQFATTEKGMDPVLDSPKLKSFVKTVILPDYFEMLN